MAGPKVFGAEQRTSLPRAHWTYLERRETICPCYPFPQNGENFSTETPQDPAPMWLVHAVRKPLGENTGQRVLVPGGGGVVCGPFSIAGHFCRT